MTLAHTLQSFHGRMQTFVRSRGGACVVDEACAVATTAAVDHPPIRQAKDKRVSIVGSLTGRHASPVGHFARVLDEPLACRDSLQGKYAPAMYRGAS